LCDTCRFLRRKNVIRRQITQENKIIADKLTNSFESNVSGDSMVYLGPIELRHTRVKTNPYRQQPTTAVSAYGKGRDLPINSETDQIIEAPGGIERRRQERRGQGDNPLLETRTGRDRRKSKTSINISI